MNNLTFLIVAFLGLCTSLIARPNVLIIMTDDQGYPELSVHGNPVLQTPNLDILHGQSIRLSDYHVTPMCTPTRGQLLTGMDAARNGAVNVSSGRALLRPEIPTIANYFSDAGYFTGVFGKWHLGQIILLDLRTEVSKKVFGTLHHRYLPCLLIGVMTTLMTSTLTMERNNDTKDIAQMF